MFQIRYYKLPGFFLFFFCCNVVVEAQSLPKKELLRHYLAKEYQKQGSDGDIFEVTAWRQHKLKSIHSSLASLPVKVRKVLVAQADAVLEKKWRLLPLSLYLEFETNGNRTNYQGAYFERRRMLTQLVIGELLEGNGKYMTAIADGLWLIMEESTWVLPAHLSLQEAGFGLPDPNEEIIDLFSAETGALLSWIRFLFSNELKEISPHITTRIDAELKTRIVQPYLRRNDFWWMGFTGRKVNNWNIWINTNVLLTAILAIDDVDERIGLIEKSIKSADHFINSYPADGGCDEGPGYWSVAGGILGLYLDMLSDVSNNKLKFNDIQLLHNIGSYIHKVHIDGNRFVNFADAPATIVPDPAKVYAYGRMFNDEELMRFAGYCYTMGKAWKNGYTGWDISTFVNNLEADAVIRELLPKAPYNKENWLPDLEVLCMRQQEGSGKGMFVGVKAGNNGESHNHNDVGNFVLYYDGKPVVIDVGPGTYTKDTFSPKRWKIWNFQSQWHNCPTINGIQQKNGKKYSADNTTYTKRAGATVFSTDISGAYPVEAKVNSWQRSLIFKPSQAVILLEEIYDLQEFVKPFELIFLTTTQPNQIMPGLIKLKAKDFAGKAITLQYDPYSFEVQVEEKEVDDPSLTSRWGDKIFRLILQSKKTSKKGTHTLTFKVEDS